MLCLSTYKTKHQVRIKVLAANLILKYDQSSEAYKEIIEDCGEKGCLNTWLNIHTHTK